MSPLVQDAVSNCQFRDWEFHVGEDGPRAYLQVQFAGDCARTGETQAHHGRKWLLSPHMTRSEIVQTCFKAVMTAVEHEAREHFRYRGQAVFGPHFDVESLARLAATNAEDAR